MEDPLAKLLVSGKELDRQLVATVLNNRVRIDRDNGDVTLVGDALQLPKRTQILLYLLARKAARALDVIPQESISPKELENKIGMTGGSLRGMLATLRKERLVDGAGRRYTIPNYAVEKIKEMLEPRRGR